jgi:hypothetical protein
MTVRAGSGGRPASSLQALSRSGTSCGPVHEERGGREMTIYNESDWGKTGARGGCLPEVEMRRTTTNNIFMCRMKTGFQYRL